MDDLHTNFLKVHMAHQRALFSYLLAAVRDPQAAEDLLQQVTLVLWKKFATYRPEHPYLAWAFGIARREVAEHFRRAGRREHPLSMEILDAVAPELEREELAAETRALSNCVEKLPDSLRELLRLRYQEGRSLKQLSASLGQGLSAINMRIVRIRRALLDCTQRALAGEAEA